MNAVEFIYYSLIVTGVIITFITLGLSSITGYIVGYSFIISGFVLLVGYLLFKLSGNYGFFSLLTIVGPFIVIIAVIGYYLSILSQYQNRITDGNISDGYYSFSKIFLFLILMQSFIFYKSLQDKQFKESHTINKVNSMVIYLLGLLSALVAITINIILAYFSTDG